MSTAWQTVVLGVKGLGMGRQCFADSQGVRVVVGARLSWRGQRIE